MRRRYSKRRSYRRPARSSRGRSSGHGGLSRSAYLLAKGADRMRKEAQLRAQMVDQAQVIAGAIDAEGHPTGATMNSAYDYTNRRQFTGRGAYSVGKFARDVGRFGRSSVGKKLISMGSDAIMGSGLYTGRGAYSDNELFHPEGSDTIPTFASSGDETGEVFLTRKEFVTDLYGNSGTTFVNQTFSLNPGLESSFPWLSQIASNYEEYEFEGVIYTYRSVVTDIGSSTNGQVGTVTMATNYNAAAPSFTDKGLMLEYAHANSSKITESMIHGIECDHEKLSGPKGSYVRSGPVPPNEDIKMYDSGKFQIAFSNTPAGFANQVVGELWVSYKVRLRKPKLFTARALGVQHFEWMNNNLGTGFTAAEGAGQADATTKVPTFQLLGQQNNIPCIVEAAGTLGSILVTLPASLTGTFMCTFYTRGTGISGTSIATPTFGGNVSFIKDTVGNVNLNSLPLYETAQCQSTFHFKVVAATGNADNTITLARSAYPTTITKVYIAITEYCPPIDLINPIWVNNSNVVTPAYNVG